MADPQNPLTPENPRAPKQPIPAEAKKEMDPSKGKPGVEREDDDADAETGSKPAGSCSSKGGSCS